MEADALKARLSSELSAESVEVALDGDRAAIVVVADVFEGLSRVKRQQMIYRYLNDSITSGVIHAVTITAKAPSER
jgi:acid stress-induced BolA-like protein IbaG/YrbA